MKKIITVETIKSEKALDKRATEFFNYAKTEQGLIEFEKILEKIFYNVFKDAEENKQMAIMLFATYADVREILEGEKEATDEAYSLFGKKCSEFLAEFFRKISTEKAIEMLRESVMEED